MPRNTALALRLKALLISRLERITRARILTVAVAGGAVQAVLVWDHAPEEQELKLVQFRVAQAGSAARAFFKREVSNPSALVHGRHYLVWEYNDKR